ncbi:PadR family transcriptional regulator [Corynebacterium pyruviciproducens]|uniref:PadR family transcriptional regulator n=2 Tax=Corynebacterium pyruviciproducens TaxID=598660 RepID=A0AAF0YS32_9CORY|nr:PadR family transcriptional regulator [Corynebacterium pyruviciproducens]WOT02294.1 PadR family transcriptional regulator [Corynebacterium pyruviciproducens]
MWCMVEKHGAGMDSQLRKGVLELVVLTLLAREPTYGGDLLARLKGNGELAVSQGTLYPLLARLRKAGYLGISWEPSPSGPPRKIYAVTDSGRAYLRQLTDLWNSFSAAVSALIRKEHHG